MPISKEEFTVALGEVLTEHRKTSKSVMRHDTWHFWIGIVVQTVVFIGALVGYMVKNESRFTSLEEKTVNTHEEITEIKNDVRDIRNIAMQVRTEVKRQGQDR